MKTMKEIVSQPESHKLAAEVFFDITADAVRLISKKNRRRMYFVGCGSSYYIAMGLSEQVKRISKGVVSSTCLSGSEIMLGLSSVESDSLVVGISRSGESSETVAALEKCRGIKNVECISLTCGSGSKIISHSDAHIVLEFIEEDSVVMTNSFTTMSFVASAMIRQILAPGLVKEYLEVIPLSTEKTVEQSGKIIEKLDLNSLNSFVFLGYNEYLAAAFEGTIKVIETSLANSNAFQTLEYRHGPISTVNPSTLVCVLPGVRSSKEEHALLRDVADKGGKTICISGNPIDHNCSIVTDYKMEDYGDWFLRAIPMQLIGVKRAEVHGINPDSPVNLTRVVRL